MQTKEQRTLTAEEIRFKKIEEKAARLSRNFEENIQRNKTGGSSVYLYNNNWVVQEHIFVPPTEDLSID